MKRTFVLVGVLFLASITAAERTMRRVILGALACLAASVTSAGPSAEQILETTGVKGGLVVHIGCGNGELTAALHADRRYVVHGLDTDPENIGRARRLITSRGIYGAVSVDTYDGKRLPYVDNLVNLLVAENLETLSMAEVRRVLAPRGVALIGGTKTVKPWPDAIDEWTHYLHGPSNNALAEDRVVGPPRHMQWLAGPTWTRHHHDDKGTYPTIRAVVSAKGRLFYLVDETRSSDRKVPSRWFLAARDGFSGVLLWKKPIAVARYARVLEQVWRSLIAVGDRVYVSLGTDLLLSALDAATGEEIRSYAGTAGFQEAIKYRDSVLVVTKESTLLALEAETARHVWHWRPGTDGLIVPLTLAADAVPRPRPVRLTRRMGLLPPRDRWQSGLAISGGPADTQHSRLRTS